MLIITSKYCAWFKTLFFDLTVRLSLSNFAHTFDSLWRKLLDALSCSFMRLTTIAHGTMTKIGTHDDGFHADEVLACFLLRQLPQYGEVEIVPVRIVRLRFR